MDHLELSDREIAKMLMNEMERKRPISEFDILLNYESHKKSRPSINKSFLKGTIKSTDSHNQREEINDCWRQHKLKDCNIVKESSSSIRDSEIRQLWASRKEANMNKSSSGMENETEEVNLIQKESSNLKSNSEKKTKKKKKHKKEKKSKKKKEKSELTTK